MKKFPIIGRFDIAPYINALDYDIITQETIWDDLVYMIMDKSKTTVILGVCTSFIRNMEWWGKGGNLDLFPAIKYQNLNIHNGFFTSAQKIISEPIIDILKAFYKQGKRIIITGHSRGAAIASCISILLYHEYNIITDLYTFGEPRSLLKSDTQTPPIHKYRFVTKSDIVTSLGTDIGTHWGDTYLLLDDICTRININNYPTTQQYNPYSHLPSNYLNTVSNILKHTSFVGISSIQFYSYIPLKTLSYLAEKLLFSINYIQSYNENTQ